MKTHLTLFCILFSVLPAPAQKYTEPDKLKSFNIVVNYDGYTVKTQMLKDVKKIKVKDDRTYMWCSAGKILETKGGYDGKLLNGYYKSFYAENGQLRESGIINYGLRGKEWRYWYADGKLKETIHYKNGKKQGKYRLFNDYGRLMAKGYFKDDLLHGSFYTYNDAGTVQDKKRYKNGQEVIKMAKAEKVKKQKPTAAPKKEKKVRKAPEQKISKETEERNSPSTVRQKKTFGQKFHDLFKKKDKKSPVQEKRPVSTSA